MIDPIIAGKVLVGANVGFALACWIARRRPTLLRLLLGTLSGVAGFLGGAMISGWARALDYEAERIDLAPRWRLLEHELVVSGFLAVLFTWIALKVRRA